MAWVASASAEDLSMLLHDCGAVAGALGEWLLPALVPLLGPVVPPAVLEAAGEALQVGLCYLFISTFYVWGRGGWVEELRTQRGKWECLVGTA